MSLEKYCRSFEELPYEIPHTFGVGVTFKDDEGIEYTSVGSEPRSVTLSVHSYKGISWGAVHYYGRLSVGDLGLRHNRYGKEEKSYIGGAFDRFKPKECLGFDIEVLRDLSREEFDSDPDRWGKYYYETTNGFMTEEELVEMGIKIFKERFKGKWILDIDGIEETYRPIPSEGYELPTH